MKYVLDFKLFYIYMFLFMLSITILVLSPNLLVVLIG